MRKAGLAIVLGALVAASAVLGKDMFRTLKAAA